PEAVADRLPDDRLALAGPRATDGAAEVPPAGAHAVAGAVEAAARRRRRRAIDRRARARPDPAVRASPDAANRRTGLTSRETSVRAAHRIDAEPARAIPGGRTGLPRRPQAAPRAVVRPR